MVRRRMAFLDDLDTPCPFTVNPQVLLCVVALVVVALYSDIVTVISDVVCVLATCAALLAVVLVIVAAMDRLIAYLAN